MGKYKMIHPNGDRVEFKKGLSFTALFFSGFVAMGRMGQIDKESKKYNTHKFAASVATGTIFTLGFANIMYLFKFNSMFKKHLEKNGFQLEENVKSVV